MRIVFYWASWRWQGNAKRRLVKHLKIPHLSTGDMFREARLQQSPMGRIAEQYMSEGKLVPDKIVLDMVSERLKRPDCAHGILFDGFPRNVFQAEALDHSLGQAGAPSGLGFGTAGERRRTFATARRTRSDGRSPGRRRRAFEIILAANATAAGLLSWPRRAGIDRRPGINGRSVRTYFGSDRETASRAFGRLRERY